MTEPEFNSRRSDPHVHLLTVAMGLPPLEEERVAAGQVSHSPLQLQLLVSSSCLLRLVMSPDKELLCGVVVHRAELCFSFLHIPLDPRNHGIFSLLGTPSCHCPIL